MIKKVITIGSDSKCDFVINRTTYPTLMDCIIDSINPIHAQIIQDGDCCLLVPFSDYIYINDMGITSLNFQSLIDSGDVKVEKGSIILDVEDEISFGIDVFWQQWMAGLGLSCTICKYRKYSLQNDEWCKVCRKNNYNPLPYVNGFSREFKSGESAASGFHEYPGCINCLLKPGWCVECIYPREPQPKTRTYKGHVEMYLKRLINYENAQTM